MHETDSHDAELAKDGWVKRQLLERQAEFSKQETISFELSFGKHDV